MEIPNRRNVVSAYASENILFLLEGLGGTLDLHALEPVTLESRWTVHLRGTSGHILGLFKGKLLTAVDDDLRMIDIRDPETSKSAQTVLTTTARDGRLAHMTTDNERIYVQGYGNADSSIFGSSDLITWNRIATSKEMDSTSRHFHDVCYDRRRRCLMVTLGDGNKTRIAASWDCGSSWDPLYTGPWQCLPILPQETTTLFGMDSALSNGLVILDHEAQDWRVVHAKWVFGAKWKDPVHFSRLIQLDSGTLLAACAQPQVVLASQDAESWYLIDARGFPLGRGLGMDIAQGFDFVATIGGGRLNIMTIDSIRDSFMEKNLALQKRLSLKVRTKGLAVTVRRKLRGW